MTELEIALLAARLLGVSVALLLAPGLLLLTVLRVDAEWPERIGLAFSLSYGWVLALSIAGPLRGWSVDGAGALTVVLVFGRGVLPTRRQPLPSRLGRPDKLTLLICAIVVTAAAAAWVVEPSFTGE